MRFARWIPVLAAIAVVAGVAVAQRMTADQGRGGKEGPWSVLGPMCAFTQTFVDGGTPAGGFLTPPTAAAQRRYIVVCNSQSNASGNIKCLADGSGTVTFATGPGLVLAKGDCVTYNVPDTLAVMCIGDAAPLIVEATECVPL